MKKITKIAILDRDGVINQNKINNGYIGYKQDFKWIKGSKKAIKLLKESGYIVVIVTNQSGIARNYFKYTDVLNLNNYINSELKRYGTKVDRIYFCPHHIDGVIKKYSIKCDCRKPKIKFFHIINKKWKVDKKNSFMIGDQKTDMLFAKKSKIKGFLFKTDCLYKFIKNKILKDVRK